MKYTYLVIDAASFIIPFLFTFHSRIRFHKRWKWFLPALTVVALFFCCWDSLFVYWGVWGFNERYISGIKIFNLPIEEILFFFCIPYACTFSYHCFSFLLPRVTSSWPSGIIAYTLIFFLIAGMFLWINQLYPFITFLLLTAILLLTAKEKYLAVFFLTCLIMVIPFLFVNGLLTGTGLDEPVVIYNSNEITGIRFFTIPLEDFFFGMLMMLMNVAGMEFLQKNYPAHE
ncbi:MAG: lycopene cyclase domain-containing protein [Chitinophagales bacterium]